MERRQARQRGGTIWRDRLAGTALAIAAALVAGAADAPPGGEARGDIAPPRPETAAESKPVREFSDAEGRVCRVYAREVVIDGEKQPAFATVCRTSSGRWVLSR